MIKLSWSFKTCKTRRKLRARINWRTFSKKTRNIEIKNEIDQIKRKDLKYETKNYIYDFQQYETISSVGDNIYTGKINIDEDRMN